MPKKWVNFETIKQIVTLEMILDHYGLTGIRQGSEVRLCCPFHEDTHPSLSANLEKGIWQCFGCRLAGDSIAFVVQREGMLSGNRNADRLAAARYLAHTFNVEEARPQRRPVEHQEERSLHSSRSNAPLTFTLNKLDVEHPYLLHDRGLTPATIAYFGIGIYHGRGLMQGRAVIPIHDAHGELIAYAGRWPGDPPAKEPKYRFPPNFRKSLVVFNLHRAREHASEGLVIVEGFFSVFELWQKGRHNVVAIMGSSLSLTQEQHLVETVGPRGRLLIALDADEAGRKGTTDAVTRLVPQVFIRTLEFT